MKAEKSEFYVMAVLIACASLGASLTARAAETNQESYDKAYEELHAKNPELYPVRVSRGIFDHKLEGKVTIRDSAGTVSELASDLDWREEPTRLPPPEGEYLADFRDFQACAVFTELNGARLCFEVAPDVSSVSLSRQRMQPADFDRLPTGDSKCDVDLQRLEFIDAKKVSGGFEVYYSAAAGPASECGDTAVVQLSVQAS